MSERTERELTQIEWDAVLAMRTAHEIIGGDPPVPYDIRGLANEIQRLRAVLLVISNLGPMSTWRCESLAREALNGPLEQ